MKMLIDTHCHLLEKEYQEIENELKKITKEKMKIIINGYDEKSNKQAIELSKKYDFIYCTVGYHPLNIEDLKDCDFKILEEQIKSEKIVAIGEIGLDYHYQKENKEKQKTILKKQLELATKYDLPVVIHNRESTKELLDILKNYNLNGVIHAFSGSLETAKEFINLGYKLGVGGVVTFKNSNLIDTIKQINFKNILLETDSPFLTPEPKRGEKNSPINVKYVAKFLEKNTSYSYDEICDITTNNAIELFDLK